LDTGVPQLVALTAYVLPGYAGLYARDLIVPAPERTTFQLIVSSLFFSLGGAALAALLVPAEYVGHVFGAASSLSLKGLLGIAIHTGASILVGLGWAGLIKYGLRHRLSRARSAFPTAWDALWSEHAPEERHVVVELASDRYFGGILAQADDPRIGRDVLLRDAREWDKKRGAYVSLNAEFTYIPADQVRRIDVGRVNTSTRGEQDDDREQRAVHHAHRDEGQPTDGRRVQQEPAQHLPRAAGTGRSGAAEPRQPDAHREPSAHDRASD